MIRPEIVRLARQVRVRSLANRRLLHRVGMSAAASSRASRSRGVLAGAALAIAAILLPAPAAAQALERTNPPGHFTPRTYSHVVRAGKLLFIAGQVGWDAQGKLVGPSLREQMEQTLKNLQTVLASQGANFSHVAKITLFVTSIDEYRAPEVQAISAKYFGDSKPAATLVQIVRLADPALKIEIEAVAALP